MNTFLLLSLVQSCYKMKIIHIKSYRPNQDGVVERQLQIGRLLKVQKQLVHYLKACQFNFQGNSGVMYWILAVYYFINFLLILGISFKS